MFSQSNEDKIVAEIFSEIGEGGKRFVEFGCGDGRQNNTIALLYKGWSGVWLEPHRRRYLSAKDRFKDYPVDVIRRIVNPGNVNKVVTDPLDFLSIDIDGEDYNVWKAIRARPRVVCIEYDAFYGTDLETIQGLGNAKGYEFYGTSASHVNAFFISK